MPMWLVMHPSVVGTGTMGLKGDLTAGEIVEQLLHAQRVTRIKNVVYMVSSQFSTLMPHEHLYLSSNASQVSPHLACTASHQ